MSDASYTSADNEGSTNKFTNYISSHPVGVPALVGVIASLALPIYVIAWKVSIGWPSLLEMRLGQASNP